ncbi:cysteate racemase [Piscinibacter terrae]|uniref:Aspartate/glutamate racemase family protein n=1 Tax=Piscinibacter terrae TaxID=2496871 RepID=A0A3N7K001_9BURK|nr:amino acid racemase [Albitalea terrae]RQP26339.1 aspartate/glutamate racemase family protein [Albitalea terrae]
MSTAAHGFLGVLGGMGPLATADFMSKLARNCTARCDQEHIPVLLYGDCTTPDRTASIVGHGPSPLPQLLSGIEFLNRAGVSAICIPCNSAHHWYAQMAQASAVPILHIAEASVSQVRVHNPKAQVVGVMSTLGTHSTGIYEQALRDRGFDVLSATPLQFETLVSPGIAHVKANEIDQAQAAFEQVALSLFDRGADVIILGCTEIPIGLQRECAAHPARYVDSTDALTLAAIDHFRRATAVR